jgi:3-phenylpropionate/trans-cinnamate dioxygenase ferredoxin reductase subunit
LLRPANWYRDRNIELLIGCAVTSIDRAAKSVYLSDGRSLRYSKLALTTGSRPKRLPEAVGGDLDGVFTIRDIADADRIAPHLQSKRRLLVIGGGYIGLEASAVAAAMGCEVTL